MSSLQYERPYLYPKQLDAIFTTKRWALCEASTKSGKTVGAIAWILEGAFGDKPGEISLWVAPVSEQAQIAFRRVKANLTPGTFTQRESPTPTIILITGAIIVFKSADNPDSIYGEDYKRAVVDEASRMKEEAWIAVRSTLTFTNGPAVLIGNVKGRRNWFYSFARRVEAGQEPNGQFRRITWQDAVAARVLNVEEIDDARRNMPENAFKELYEAEASDDAGNPFGLDHIKACIRGLSNRAAVAYGIDLAKKKDYIVVIGLDEFGQTCHFSRWTGVPWRNSIRRIHDIVGEDTRALVDSTGVGDPVLEELQVGHGNFSGYHFSPASKQKLMEGLAVGIQSHEITFPDGPIRHELEVFEYEMGRTGVKYSAPEGFHDDCVCSLALARQQWAEVAPGANVQDYMIAMAERDRRAAESYDEAREEVAELMPWRNVGIGSYDLDNELTDLYNATIRAHPSFARATRCAHCQEEVRGPHRVSDGIHVWHPECMSLGTQFAAELSRYLPASVTTAELAREGTLVSEDSDG